jgi:hypothetical protein
VAFFLPSKVLSRRSLGGSLAKERWLEGDKYGRPKRQRVEPTDDWDTLMPLFWWPEQEEYEKIRQPVLFDTSIAERAEEVGVSESTLRRRIETFRTDGMESLFPTEKARRRQLPATIRGFIVDLKAEYPPFSLGGIANTYNPPTRARAPATNRAAIIQKSILTVCTTPYRLLSGARRPLPESGFL